LPLINSGELPLLAPMVKPGDFEADGAAAVRIWASQIIHRLMGIKANLHQQATPLQSAAIPRHVKPNIDGIRVYQRSRLLIVGPGLEI